MLQVINKLLNEYPPGTRIKILDECNSEIRTVVGYRSYYDDWYLKLDNDTSVHIQRINECVEKV